MTKKRRFYTPPPKPRNNWALFYGQPTLPALAPAPGRVVATILSDTGKPSPETSPNFDPNFDPNVGIDGTVVPSVETIAFSNGFSLGFQ